jgi:2-methylisocitrate lyase-like PEP mutase family enzyme
MERRSERGAVTQGSKVADFRALHASGCFVLPNPWDVGSARYLAHLGFKALATTSGGLAFSRGVADSAVARDAVLRHVQEVAEAVDVPVNADFEGGFAVAPEQVAANVSLCARTGVAGLSIEDATGARDEPLYDVALAVDRIRAARAAIDASGTGVLLTARCEAYLVGHPEPQRTVIERLSAFAAAGADCLYAPGVRDVQEIAAIVRAVDPKPVNVLVSAPSSDLTVARLAGLGVRRISVGSALARAAWRGFLDAARALAGGSFDGLAGATPYAELNAFFGSAGG